MLPNVAKFLHLNYLTRINTISHNYAFVHLLPIFRYQIWYWPPFSPVLTLGLINPIPSSATLALSPSHPNSDELATK